MIVMDQPKTITELAALERQLMVDLAQVRVWITERAGQVDPPEKPKRTTK